VGVVAGAPADGPPVDDPVPADGCPPGGGGGSDELIGIIDNDGSLCYFYRRVVKNDLYNYLPYPQINLIFSSSIDYHPVFLVSSSIKYLGFSITLQLGTKRVPISYQAFD
jgi:hypothetical protein